MGSDVAPWKPTKPAVTLGCGGVADETQVDGQEKDLDGDLAEREAIMAIDGHLEVPEFLKRTLSSRSEA